MANEIEIPEGFTPWNGGDQPLVDGQVVDVFCRDRVQFSTTAETIVWAHSLGKWDVVGYRVAKP